MLAVANRLNVGDVGTASDLLRHCDARLMRCYPVSTRINGVANDDEKCSAPVELAQVRVGFLVVGLGRLRSVHSIIAAWQCMGTVPWIFRTGSILCIAVYWATCRGRSMEVPAACSERRYGTSVAITAITNTSIKMCIASGAR